MTAGFCRHAEHPLKFSEQFEAFKCLYQHDPDISMPATQIIPGGVLQWWSVHEHQNQKYAYHHGALVLLILLAGSYR